MGSRVELYRMAKKAIQLCEVTYIRLFAPHRDKSCGRVADKFGLRAWTINLRTWIFGFTCLVFKTTCIDRRISLREGAFFFTRRTLFPPLDKRNTRDKVKGRSEPTNKHAPPTALVCRWGVAGMLYAGLAREFLRQLEGKELLLLRRCPRGRISQMRWARLNR